MSEFAKNAAEFSDQYLSSIEKTQEQFLQLLTPCSQWASNIKTPAFAPNLPTPREIFESNFNFTNKLLKQQHAFVQKVLAAATPTV
ncbi:MAG: hypothetical protein PVF50_11430 [Gammaproteobacteria bacterium]|jgi:hypothetical protein